MSPSSCDRQAGSGAEVGLYIGSYTASMGEAGRGIYALASGSLEVYLAVAMDSPSFLAVSADWLFAVSESGSGRVSSFRRDGAGLELVSTVSTGGPGPCHVVYDSIQRNLLIANFLGGSWAVVPVREDGSLGAALVTALGRTSDLRGEEGPRAHQTIHSDAGGDRWLVSDLGMDRICEYGVGPGGTVSLVEIHPLPPGTGPRHMAWASGALLVVGEADSNLHVLRRRNGAIEHVAVVPTFDTTGKIAHIARNYPSHIAVSSDGQFGYVANRGRDSISVFGLAGLARGEEPELLQETWCGGLWPRHFEFHEGRLHVANQKSNAVSVFEMDGESGMVGALVSNIGTGSPACLAPIPYA